MSDFELERSPEARKLAEDALFLLLGGLEAHDLDLVVLGGLVPEVLTGGQDDDVPGHLGTTDIDVHVSFATDPAGELGALEGALEEVGAEPDPDAGGWRWRIPLGGTNVKLEFLCDREDQTADQAIPLPGCARLKAANLRGTRFVASDWTVETIERSVDGTIVSRQIRFAALEGYLLAKSYAVRFRSAGKDYYDLVHVLLYNKAGGPAAAGVALRDGKFADDVQHSRTVFLEIAARFDTTGAFGPQSYVAQALRIEPEADRAVLAQDAVGGVREFLEALGF